MAENIVMASGQSVKNGEVSGAKAVFDLWAFNSLELELSILDIKTSLTGFWVAMTLETSMDRDPKGQWQYLGAFTPLVDGCTDRRRFTGFLRYVRWQIATGVEGDATVTFNLRGMAR